MLQRAGNGGKMDRESRGRSRRGNTRATKSRPGRSRKRIELTVRPLSVLLCPPRTSHKRSGTHECHHDAYAKSVTPRPLPLDPAIQESSRRCKTPSLFPLHPPRVTPNRDNVRGRRQYAYTTSVTPPLPLPLDLLKIRTSEDRRFVHNTPSRPGRRQIRKRHQRWKYARQRVGNPPSPCTPGFLPSHLPRNRYRRAEHMPPPMPLHSPFSILSEPTLPTS
jgi:hypothetical protein